MGKTRSEVLDSPSPWIETLGRVALTGRPETVEDYSPALNRHLLVKAYSPQPGQVACLVQDITEVKRAEEMLREREEKFRAAFAHVPVGMVITDLEGRFLHVNRAYCRITGYTEQELRQPDFDFQRLTHPDDLGGNLEEMRRLLAGEIPAFFVEKRYLRKDGATAWVRDSASLRRDSAGRPNQVVGLVEDITDRK